MSRADEIRRELALLEELRGIEEGGEPEDDAAEGERLILLELLGEFVKQQIVQETPEPLIGEEHFALAAVLTQEHVQALEAQGWIDPCPRDWRQVAPPPVMPSAPPKRVVLRPAPAGPPPSLLSELNGHGDTAALIEREVKRRLAEAQGVPQLFDPDDDDMPPELRTEVVRPKKPKKPKKPKPPPDVIPRYADGTPVEPQALRVDTRYLVDGPVDPSAVEPVADSAPVAPTPRKRPAKRVAPVAAASPEPVGWTKGPDDRLIPPPGRKPVKAVYPAPRQTKRQPKAIALGGMVTSSEWKRDGAGRRVLPGQEKGD